MCLLLASDPLDPPLPFTTAHHKLLQQVVLCANTPEEHQELLAAGCDAIYCNHNAWLNYDTIFTDTPAAHSQSPARVALAPNSSSAQACGVESAAAMHNIVGMDDAGPTQQQHKQEQQCRRWDLVVNANSSPFKRSYLAAGVPNRVHITYNAEQAERAAALATVQFQQNDSVGCGVADAGPGMSGADGAVFVNGADAAAAAAAAAPCWVHHCINLRPDGTFR